MIEKCFFKGILTLEKLCYDEFTKQRAQCFVKERQVLKMIIDDYRVKVELVKLAIWKHTGTEIDEDLLNKILKFLSVEYENNTSKNSLDNRINSICKTITNKYDKYMKNRQLY